MRRTWNLSYLAGHYARWLFAVCVMLPAGLLVGLLLTFVWLLWLGLSGVQAAMMSLQSVSLRHTRGPAGGDLVRAPSGARVSRDGDGTLSLELPQRGVRKSDQVKRGHDASAPRRPTALDLQRSLEGMARYGWPKDKVLAALKSAGAGWVWSQKDGMREYVYARYREGATLLARYTSPAARIHLTFDAAGRLERAGVDRLLKI